MKSRRLPVLLFTGYFTSLYNLRLTSYKKGVINLLATSDPEKIETFDISAINLGQLSAHFQLNSNITIAISVPALVIFIAAVIVAIFLIVIYIMLCLQRRHVSQLTEISD